MTSLIQRLRNSAAHYRKYTGLHLEVFPVRLLERHVDMLTEAADEIERHRRNGLERLRADLTHDWRVCLDAANRNAAEARANADRLANQLFEAREQRDEARESSAANGAEAERAREYEVKMRLKAARALTEVDALRKQRDAHVCAAQVNVYSSTPPHDHVVMSLANYSKLVTERDEALAKYAACVDTVSFVDGRWVRTS
jgi:hypothetical protein